MRCKNVRPGAYVLRQPVILLVRGVVVISMAEPENSHDSEARRATFLVLVLPTNYAQPQVNMSPVFPADGAFGGMFANECL